MTILKLAIRNLFRYTRRTLLTASLIVFGVILVTIATAVTTGFRTSVIDLLTNTQLSHFQVHKKGYMASIDAVPLNIFMKETEMNKLIGTLNKDLDIEVFSPRIKFTSIISIGANTSNIRLTAVYPEKESKACPGIVDQMKGIKDKVTFLKPGEIIIPDVIAKGLSLKIGNEVILVSTSRQGSMNGAVLKVAGIMKTYEGPSGRAGYIHINDAKNLLRMDTLEISEVAVRVKNAQQGNTLNIVMDRVKSELSGLFEVHSWEKLTPFASILVLVNLINVMVEFILIAIVLISVLNIMMMSVYERTQEIGTIAAIGTIPSKILKLFLSEGILLGLFSTIIGSLLGSFMIGLLNHLKIHFQAGPFTMILNGAIKPIDMMITIIIVTVISLFASFQPAFKAANLDPVDALGHV